MRKFLFCCVVLLLLSCMAAVTQDTMTMPDGSTMSTPAAMSGGSVMPMSAVGNEYTATEQYDFADNFGNCAAYNCWIQNNLGTGGGAVSFVKMSSGYDGYTVGIDGAGNFWALPFATTVAPRWTKVTSMGAGAKGLAVRSADDIYALYSDPSCSVGYSMKRWDGAVWHPFWGCAFDVSASLNDNTLAVIGSDRGLYYTTNPLVTQPTWVGVAPGTFTSIAAVDSTTFYGVKANVLYQFVNGAASTVSGAPVITSGASAIAVTFDNYLFTVAASGANGTLFVRTPAGSWVNQKGNPVLLGGSSRLAMFTQSGTNLVYHYLGVALRHTSTVTGFYDCGTTGCPAGSMHTATAMGNFPHGTNSSLSNSVTVTPATRVNVPHIDVSILCDPVFGDPSSPDCFLSGSPSTTQTGRVNCNVMGLIYSSLASWSIQKEFAYTKFKNIGLRSGGGCVESGGHQVCSYNVLPICSNTSTPDYRYPGGPAPDAWFRDWYFPAWRSIAGCSRVVWSGGHSAWLCQNLVVLTIGTLDTTPTKWCAYNP